jgi:PEGA domain
MGKRLRIAFVAAGLLAGSCKAQTVVLTSDPPGATILLRGTVEVSRTPLSLHLLPGLPMEITSRWGSLAPLTVTVTPEKEQAVVHRFEHLYGTLIVESDRMDAALRIDGEDYGNVPSLLLLPPGRHKVFLEAANAPDKTREVEIKVGYRTSVRINFAGGSPETQIEPEGVPRRVPVPRPSPTPAPPGGSLFALEN